MIKIINGIYGLREGNSIIPKTSKDEPFECDKAEEARLVKLGVAEYVACEEVAEDAPLYTDATSLAELKEIAKTIGATDDVLKSIKSKAAAKELIDALAETYEAESKTIGEAEEETEEVAEDAPTFEAVDGVV